MKLSTCKLGNLPANIAGRRRRGQPRRVADPCTPRDEQLLANRNVVLVASIRGVPRRSSPVPQGCRAQETRRRIKSIRKGKVPDLRKQFISQEALAAA